MSEKQVRDYDKFMLRFPDGMRDAISERAKQNGRSMNSEIIQILQDALDAEVNVVEAQGLGIPGYVPQPHTEGLGLSKELLEKILRVLEESTEALNQASGGSSKKPT